MGTARPNATSLALVASASAVLRAVLPCVLHSQSNGALTRRLEPIVTSPVEVLLAVAIGSLRWSASDQVRNALRPLARITGWASAGVSPEVMGLGPVPATRKLLDQTGTSLSDIDLVELNEAFAAQVIACDRELNLDPERLNVRGGSIALGHPIGATGCRIAVTLLGAMEAEGAKKGLATLCISGGMGLSVLFERESS